MSADLRTDSMRKRYEEARNRGEECRRNGGKAGDNPFRGSTTLVRDLNHEWARGWLIEDQRRKGQR